MSPRFISIGEFVASCVTPYHTVRAATQLLIDAGFCPTTDLHAEPGLYLSTHGDKTLFAWITPPKRSSSLNIVSAHTDSPALKVKRNPFFSQNGSQLIATQPYGGPNISSWLDRDLNIAGLLCLEDDGKLSFGLHESSLICRTVGVPTHASDAKSPPNPQFDLHAFIGPDVKLNTEALWRLLFPEIPEHMRVVEHDLFFFDANAPRQIGAGNGLLSSSRLDNLASCYSAISGLIQLASCGSPHTSVIALFDAEEIGSGTWIGAKSPLLARLIEKITPATREPERASHCHLSLDVAHAVHPLSPDLFDDRRSPLLGAGLTVKYGVRGNYSYEAKLMASVRVIAKQNQIKLQDFSYRADKGQGGSLGPHASTALAIRSIDAGIPILSMHSVRELCSIADVEQATKMVKAFLGATFPT